MSRKKTEKKRRHVSPDSKFNDLVLSKFINMVMKKGKKSTAEAIVYGALDLVVKKTGSNNPLGTFQAAIDNARPLLEVRPRRIGGATYQVPVEVTKERGAFIALRWIRDFARNKKGKPMDVKLAEEIISAYKNEGAVNIGFPFTA